MMDRPNGPNDLYDFRRQLASVVLTRLRSILPGISAHFGESYESARDPEAIAYHRVGGAFCFLAFAFAPWRMWDLHIGVVPVGGRAVSIGYHISERSAPILLASLREVALRDHTEVAHQAKAIEFQANLPVLDSARQSIGATGETVCGLCKRFAQVAHDVACPPSMHA